MRLVLTKIYLVLELILSAKIQTKQAHEEKLRNTNFIIHKLNQKLNLEFILSELSCLTKNQPKILLIIPPTKC